VLPLEVSLGPNKSLALLDQATKVSQTRLTKEQLVARVLEKQQGGQEQAVVIKADKNARYEDVIEILDLLQRNGVRKVGLLARPAS
jgi:biopolymer transport protein TolR